jgi:hypothetical protein
MLIVRSIVLLSAAVAVQVCSGPLLAADAVNGSGVIRLFNGRNLEGFDTFLKTKGLNNDPDRVFQVQDGMLHISGTEYGYVITRQEYENYHLRAEFKWGEGTFAPRAGRARDSGILFHVVGPNDVWPKSIEYQMIEGRTGEIILVGDGTSITVGGVTVTRGKDKGTHIARHNQGPWQDVAGYRDPKMEYENPHGEWNVMELFADGDTIKFVVNGKVANIGTGANPARGKILFQCEGAEIWFRNMELRPLSKK